MTHLFDFGISQEDAFSEKKALDICEGDRLLSITSAGDVALNMLARNQISIKCVDVSGNQNKLLKIKLSAVQNLDPNEAAGLLGYIQSNEESRLKYFNKIVAYMSEEEKVFWGQHNEAIKNGVINAARFEKYMVKYNGMALGIIGKKKLMGLFELDDIKEQYKYFDLKIRSLLVKALFKIVFHPKIYKGKGIASEGFKNSVGINISDFFYGRFKDFCCSTLARKNYFLQFSFFNKVLFQDALPDFLTDNGVTLIRQNISQLNIETNTITKAILNSRDKQFNKFHISNVGDWISKGEYADLLRLIYKKSDIDGRISSRYIHYRHDIPDDLCGKIIPNYQLGDEIVKTDRYPFYSILPLVIHKNHSDE